MKASKAFPYKKKWKSFMLDYFVDNNQKEVLLKYGTVDLTALSEALFF
jgi:hypothetical protein